MTEVLTALAVLAAETGPSLAPVGLDEQLAAVVATAQHLTGATAGSVALVDGGELVFRVATGPGAERITGVRIPVGRGIAGWAVSSGQAVALDDVSQDPRFARDVAEAIGYVPRGIVAVPLDTDDEILGVLELLDPAPGRLALSALSLLARQAALSVVTTRAFTDFGRLLFTAAATAVDGTDLARALRAAAAQAPAGRAEPASLAADLAALSRLGAEERETAHALLRTFLGYAAGRDR
ncbi:GAF domain-containing protein [Amycolatopsis xylanica]|uniref:GAF domain-containing protein n=1 Tax=Amycolatopsis xylanica TaxID=589385 RepID=UPI001C4093E7|nr:GAF domain-containing protein [Amycolatopsis xylanica]